MLPEVVFLLFQPQNDWMQFNTLIRHEMQKTNAHSSKYLTKPTETPAVSLPHGLLEIAFPGRWHVLHVLKSLEIMALFLGCCVFMSI